ncbi:hypothetical protein K435DRAFT_490973 [Dendrothele bispora CBS 962.96]|uniref:Uncharacterized protein n=1 Tax=Dendrothele bispora (strain CBS 962.96) TaxID=1314807 RepID=A0A4S8MBG2_DENBC|nr:hypothetical protein K435DRAFT_490973 [Dendrothele bispora CBS 962.96]
MPTYRPRSTSIHRAITQALSASEPITVSHILPIYTYFAGFDSICPDAIVAFEHAMDKGRVVGAVSSQGMETPTNSRNRELVFEQVILEASVEQAVVKLRNEYWKEKLGRTKKEKDSCSVCMCEECGRMRLVKSDHVSAIAEGPDENSQYVVMKAKDLKVISSSSRAHSGESPDSKDSTKRSDAAIRKGNKSGKAKKAKKKFVQAKN